jgi:hypothetical protein
MRFFFYGTLMDPDVRAIVLGREAALSAHVRDAVLFDWERRATSGVSYPIVLSRPGEHVNGMIVSGLDTMARRALVAYEGPFFQLMRVNAYVANGAREALVFVPASESPLTPEPGGWSYPHWVLNHKKTFVAELIAERNAAGG